MAYGLAAPMVYNDDMSSQRGRRKETMTDTLTTFLAVIDTPRGAFEVEVPTSLGADAAGRRAFMAIAQRGGFDMNRMSVRSVEAI